jgi:hypothetical protein
MLRRTPTPVAADNRSVVDALLKRERAFGQVKASAPMRVAAILALLLLCLMNTSSARADSASCLARAASFVTELDELLEKEQYSIRPHKDLMKEYFPLRDCEAEACWMWLEVRDSSGRYPTFLAGTNISSGSKGTTCEPHSAISLRRESRS